MYVLGGTYLAQQIKKLIAMVAGDTLSIRTCILSRLQSPHNPLEITELARRKLARLCADLKTPCNLPADPSGQGYLAPDDEPFAHFKDVIANPPRCATALRDLKDFEAAMATNSLPQLA